jgi:hypothetical protein
MLGGPPADERDEIMPMGNDELIEVEVEEDEIDLGGDDEDPDDDLEGI